MSEPSPEGDASEATTRAPATSTNGANGTNGAHAPDGTNGARPTATRPRPINGRLPPRHPRGASNGTNGATATDGASANGATTLEAPPPALATAPAASVAANGNGASAVAAPATAPPVPPRKGKASLSEMFVSFRLADFRYLALSTVAVGFGQWAQQIGLFVLIFQLTDSPTQLGVIAAFRGGIGVVVAPFGGVLADRYPRRIIIVWATIFGAVIAGVLATMVVLELVQVWHVYVFALSGGILQSINQPARQAFVYDVSTDETLPNAVAMNSVVQNLSRVAGPPLAGAMIGFLGIASPFIFIVVAQLIATVLTLAISRKTRQVRVRGGSSAFRQIGEGFRYTWKDHRILGLVVVSAIPSLLVYPYIPFLLVIAEDVLGQGATGFGLLASMLGWGSIVGLMLLAAFGPRLTTGKVMLFCFTVYAALLIAFAWSTVFVLSLGILAIAGIFHSIGMALNNTLIQLAVQNELRGRVMAVWQMSHGLQPLGSLPMGLLVATAGPQIGIGSFMIAATVIFMLFAATWGSVRRM